MANRARRSSFVVVAACAVLLSCRHTSFVGVRSHRLAAPTRLQATVTVPYPHLSRVEDLIYDGCVVMETEQQLECLRAWDKLTNFHKETEVECNLDDLRCVVLDVLDRLCKGIESRDGLVLLHKTTDAVMAIRHKFDDWTNAFSAADRDNTGKLELQDLQVAMKEACPTLSDAEVELCFNAADTNGDGVLSREEFADFLTAAVFAEKPLRDLQVDSLPESQPDLLDYLHWSTAGRTQSWAGLASLARSG